MKVNVIAIGKIKEKYFLDAISEYSKRLSRYVDFKVIELPDAPPSKTADEQRKIESDALMSKAKGFVVALDPRGKELSSEEFATFIETKCTEGVSEFSFLIGGSHGHTEELRTKTDMVLSFGKPTFPHQLFRVMVAEQVYRAFSIINGTPYHK
ncbi:MAG: 23S rRNA (pseudouridine(1915)-N(3))-methyltransferase RlmH [Clostridia bacterium]|nr:23S rRNA (pseudouridine(1915)-N(3))-methyltransferase RlmH [Clostridia bacterium]